MKHSSGTGAAAVISVAVFDFLFSLFHLCQYFFRLTRFNFLLVQKSMLPIYQIFWIALFAKHILQMFLSGSLFLCARDMHSKRFFSQLIFTCQFWCGISTLFIMTSLFDGVLLSVANVILGFSDNTLNLSITLKAEVSPEIMIHVVEIVFRIFGLYTIHSFINEFLCCYHTPTDFL